MNHPDLYGLLYPFSTYRFSGWPGSLGIRGYAFMRYGLRGARLLTPLEDSSFPFMYHAVFVPVQTC